MKGLAGLKLTYSFEAGWKFLRVTPAREEMKPIAGTPREMGMWLYGDGSGNLVRVRFSDSVGQVFQPNAVKIDFKGWRWVTIPLDGREAAHWGASLATYVRRSYELYPTAIVAALALMALVTRYRDRTVRLGAALVLVGIAFSLGPSPEGSAFVSPYDLVRRLPGLSILRTPVRLGVLALFGLDLLAGVAAAALARGGSWARAGLAAAAVLLAVELHPGDLRPLFRPLPPIPASARWLASCWSCRGTRTT